MKQLQDLCRDVKDQKNLTLQDISDASGIPLSTVNNFFSASSRLPSIGTAGPICKVLGVSLDSYYGIIPPEHELQERLHDLELENVRLTERNRIITQNQKHDHHIVRVQSVFIAVLVVALLAYLVIDANIRTEGLIVHGQPSVIALILIALVVLSAVAAVISNIRVTRNKHK